MSKKDALNSIIKLMKAKALRKHSLHEKTAASVLLKLFIMLCLGALLYPGVLRGGAVPWGRLQPESRGQRKLG